MMVHLADHIARQRPEPSARPVTSDTVTLESAWRTVPLFGQPSLEEVLARGYRVEGDYDEDLRRVTVNSMPGMVAVLVGYIQGQLGWSTEAAVMRRLLRTGMFVVRRIEALEEMEVARNRAVEEGDDFALWTFAATDYPGLRSLNGMHVPKTLYLPPSDDDRLAEFKAVTGISKGTLALACVAAGLGQSTASELVPLRYRQLCAEETLRFIRWLERQAEKL